MAKKVNPALMAKLTPSTTLAAVIGSKPIPRGQAMKKIWDYIKSNNLQDPKNKRNIKADAKLAPLFKGKKVISMFELTKFVSANLSK